MGVLETYSKRKKKRENAGKPDVYQYDKLPKQLIGQIIHIWADAIGPYWQGSGYGYAARPNNNDAWNLIVKMLCRELGVFSLTDDQENPFIQCQYYLQRADVDHALDLIELSFKYVSSVLAPLQGWQREDLGIQQNPQDAVEELNQRFRENGVGYQFLDDEIVRVDSQFVHDQVVKPALSLLQSAGFSGPEDEFLKAHEHYRHRRYKEALSEALKAFESTLKAVCDQKDWEFPANATSRPLIELVFKNGLLPSELQAHFSALRATLEAGIPTVRNTQGGHGQGAKPVEVPDYVVAYGLNLAAAGIVFLVEALRSSG